MRNSTWNHYGSCSTFYILHFSFKSLKMKQEYTITVYTENQIGLLNRIAIIFSRRKINIESLNVSPSEIEGIHRFTLVVNETEDVVSESCTPN